MNSIISTYLFYFPIFCNQASRCCIRNGPSSEKKVKRRLVQAHIIYYQNIYEYTYLFYFPIFGQQAPCCCVRNGPSSKNKTKEKISACTYHLLSNNTLIWNSTKEQLFHIKQYHFYLPALLSIILWPGFALLL